MHQIYHMLRCKQMEVKDDKIMAISGGTYLNRANRSWVLKNSRVSDI